MKKYEQLFKLIEQDILSEKYSVGEFLPSEQELAQYHKISRDTVRKALDKLQKEGLIQKFKGQGSKVIKHEFDELSRTS